MLRRRPSSDVQLRDAHSGPAQARSTGAEWDLLRRERYQLGADACARRRVRHRAEERVQVPLLRRGRQQHVSGLRIAGAQGRATAGAFVGEGAVGGSREAGDVSGYRRGEASEGEGEGGEGSGEAGEGEGGGAC